MKETFLAKLNYNSPFAYELLDFVGHFPDFKMKRFGKINIKSGDGLVLELGCGTGRSSWIFQKKNITVINLDINEAFVKYGKIRGRITNPVVCSAYDLCFPDNKFDKIIISDAFHHLLEHDPLFEECHRILKPGAELIIFDVVMEKNATNTIISHYADGPVWFLNIQGFRKKLDELAHKYNFKSNEFRITQKEKKLMGLLGRVDIIVRLKKR